MARDTLIDEICSNIAKNLKLDLEAVKKASKKTTPRSISRDTSREASPRSKVVLYTEDDLKNLKNVELQDLCKQKSLKYSGTKAVLVERLLEHAKNLNRGDDSHEPFPPTGKEGKPLTKPLPVGGKGKGKSTSSEDVKEKKPSTSSVKEKKPTTSVKRGGKKKVEPMVLSKIKTLSQEVGVSASKHGNNVTSTGLVFDVVSQKCIGKELEDGTVIPVNEEIIEECHALKVEYKLPLSLNSKNRIKDKELSEESILNEDEDEEDEEGDVVD